MKKFIPFSFFFLFILSSIQAQEFNYGKHFDTVLARTSDPNDSLYHVKLEKRFHENDSSLSDFEVLAILIHFTADDHYAPYSILSAEEKIGQYIKRFQFQKAINLGDSVLLIHPYNQSVLLNMAYSYYKLENQEKGDYYRYQFNRIMDAMASSGKGTAEEPIFSLGSKDSENFIYEKLSKEIMTIGSGLDSSGNFIDIMEITDYQKDTIVIHFQIQHVIDRMYDSETPEK